MNEQLHPSPTRKATELMFGQQQCSGAVLRTCKLSVFLHRHVVQAVPMLLSKDYYYQEAKMVLGDHLFVGYICV